MGIPRSATPRSATSRVIGALMLAGVVVLTGLALGPRPTTAAVPSRASACVNGWQQLPVPDEAFLSTAFAVIPEGSSPAWIVGGANNGVLALRWDGSSWRSAATETRGHRGLVGGAVLGPGRLLGVGYYRPNSAGDGQGSLKPISGRIARDRWKDREVPDPPGPRATLTDVAALPSGRAWAVGTRLDDGRLRAYALRWTGSRWLRREPRGGSGSGLLSVERAPSGEIWAVGWKETRLGQPRPYIVRRAGGRWSVAKAAAVPAGSAVLTGLAFRTASEGYAVGYVSPTGSDRPRAILLGWDGGRWQALELPWAGDFSAMPRSISVGADGRLWIAGTQPANDTREPRGFIARRDAGGWVVSTLDVPSDVRSEVMAVAATDAGVVAAASVGGSLLVLGSCDEGTVVAARKSRAVTRAKVRVGNMKARRASMRIDQQHVPEGPAMPRGDDRFSLADTTVRLAAPVAPSGFTVRNMARSSGLKQRTKTFRGFAADLDGNGYRDVFYSRHGMVKPRLAMNGPNGFVDGPTAAFGSVDRHGCAAGDVDRDGAKDILCSVGSARGKTVNRHELSLAPFREDGRVALGALGIGDPLGRGRYVAIFRLDDDRYPEVFIANAPDRDDGWPGYNRFYRNVNGTFVPAPGVGLDSSHGAECVEATDVDRDGDVDLAYCTQYGFDGRPAGLRLMRNENGVLRDRTRSLGIQPIGDIDVAFADVTGDRRRDLIQLGPDRLRVSQWTRKGYRRIFETRVPDAWAVAAGDASGDGRADIYVLRGDDRANQPDRLLVSRKRGRDFVSVRIPQTRQGSADDVIALDYDRNGLTDFVVLNGRRRAGPVQLLAAFPRA